MKRYKLTNRNHYTGGLSILVIKNSICEIKTDEEQRYIDRLNKMGDFKFEEIKETVNISKPDVEERIGNVRENDPVDITTKKSGGSGVRSRGRSKKQ